MWNITQDLDNYYYYDYIVLLISRKKSIIRLYLSNFLTEEVG